MPQVDYLKEKVRNIIQLPTLPVVAMEVASLVDNPKTSAAALGRVISTDQALTARMLKIANSAFYGFPKRISTIDFAIVVLGFDALKEIVMSVSIINSFRTKTNQEFNAEQFWQHSIVCGITARQAAQNSGYRISGEAFVAGLLHDIGILILHQHFRREFQEILQLQQKEGIPYLEAEEHVLGTTHAEVGSWLAERWNLPNQLVEAIAYHHNPDEAQYNPKLVTLLHFADVFSMRLQECRTEYDAGIDFNADALKLLNPHTAEFTNEFSDKYMSQIHHELEKVKALFT